MISLNDKRIRTLILVMSVLVAIVIVIVRIHFRKVNESVDPRIAPARQLYSQYNLLASDSDFEGVFILLDSIEKVYGQYPHYTNSYEVGVLYNNRAAALLTMAIHKDSMYIASAYFNKLSADTLFVMAEEAIKHGITVYENWMNAYSNSDANKRDSILKADFFIGLESYTEADKELYLASRTQEIESALYENERRLSVSYTNLGIIARHNDDYELALLHYKKALDLWDRNLVAENNINMLMGRPLKKRNIIQKLFPPEKDD